MERFFAGMFLFLPCLEIYEREGGNPFTDLDLVCIKDGKFIIGEVKSEPDALEEADFVKMREVASDIQPDHVLFAAPGESWPPQIEARIATLAEELRPFEIVVSPLHLRWL